MGLDDSPRSAADAERECTVLRQRVADLERQLRRSGDQPIGLALSEREALLVEAEQIAHMGSWVWSVETGEVRWSDELYRILGYDRDRDPATIEGFFARVHPDDVARVRADSARGVATGLSSRVEFRVLRPDGVVRHVTMDGAILVDDSGAVKRAVGTVLDTTETKQARLALERSAALLAEAQRIGKMGSYEWDLATGTMAWSDELRRIFGVDSAATPSVKLFESFVHPDDRAMVRERIVHAETTGIVEPTDVRIVTRDGVRHLHLVGVAITDAAGHRVGFRGIVSDLSERIALQQQLLHAQKMEAIGRLAGGIAHDFNNLLTVIIGSADELRDAHDNSAIRDIASAASSAAALTKQILAFSRQAVIQPKLLDLNAVVGVAAGLARRSIGEDVELRWLPGADLWAVRADVSQIEQVVLNLAINSRDAMPSGGVLAIATKNTALASNPSRPDGNYVVLSVADTGVGMDPVTRSRAFDPFFTTKEPTKGTGLGLAIVFGAMEQAGGFVEVESEVGQGTVFRLWFPRADPSSDSAAERVASRRAPAGKGSILLVEDEAPVRNVVERMLRGAGYVVHAVGSAEEALALVERGLAPDTLATDVVMPQMNGPALAAKLLESKPDLRVLYLTGYAPGSIDTKAPHTSLLQKPFRSEALKLALARLWEPASPG